MQESRYDGSDVFTSNPTREQIEEAVNNPKNKTVSIHKAGSVIELKDGTQYIVQENGSWKRSYPQLTQGQVNELYGFKKR